VLLGIGCRRPSSLFTSVKLRPDGLSLVPTSSKILKARSTEEDRFFVMVWSLSENKSKSLTERHVVHISEQHSDLNLANEEFTVISDSTSLFTILNSLSFYRTYSRLS